MEHSPDSLLTAITKGDTRALRHFYELFQTNVYNTCLFYLQSEPEAEEATQDVFLEVFRSASAFRSDSSVKTWVYRITVNKCLDRIRHRNRAKRFAFMASLFNKDTGALQYDVPAFNHPGVALENKEHAAFLFRAIKALPEAQQTAFILRQVEGLSQKEITVIMNISEKAVESLIQRAKLSLRKSLADIYDQLKGKQ